jgi:putative membrane protein
MLALRGIGGVVVFFLLLGRPVLAGAAAAYALVSNLVDWWRRTWSFDGTTLTLDDGVLHRTYRRVPIGRVQQVEVNEPFLHRVAGLAVVRIETAGGAGSAEIALDAIGRREAIALQSAVLEARGRAVHGPARPPGPPGASNDGTPLVPPPPPAGELVLHLGTGRIMVSGMLGSNLLVVFALMGGFFDLVSRLPRSLGEAVESEAGELVTGLGVAMGLLALVVVALGAAALAAVAAHHDLTVVRRGNELRLRRGLLERRDAIVPLARVQAVSIGQNPAQRLVGLYSVAIRSAGTAEGGDVRFGVPAANRSEVDRLVTAALGRPVDVAQLAAAPNAARSRRIVRRAAVLVPPVAAAVLLASFAPLALTALAVAVSVAVVTGLDAYTGLGHRLDPDLLVTRSGSLLRRTVVVVRGRVQSTRVRASLFQRRRSLATLAVDLAGRGPTPMVIDQVDRRCAELARALRAAPVSTDRSVYATLGARPPTPNEEP